MLVGYARVSTQEQDLALQLDALHGDGCGRVFEEKASGAQRERPELTVAEVAKRLGVAASTLYRHLPRARTAALDA